MQDLGSDTSSVWTFSACSSDVITREASGGVAKYRMFSQDNVQQKFAEVNIHAVYRHLPQLVKKNKRFFYKVDKRNAWPFLSFRGHINKLIHSPHWS